MTEESLKSEIDMTKEKEVPPQLTRRDFLKLAGGAVAVIAAVVSQ